MSNTTSESLLEKGFSELTIRFPSEMDQTLQLASHIFEQVIVESDKAHRVGIALELFPLSPFRGREENLTRFANSLNEVAFKIDELKVQSIELEDRCAFTDLEKEHQFADRITKINAAVENFYLDFENSKKILAAKR